MAERKVSAVFAASAIAPALPSCEKNLTHIFRPSLCNSCPSAACDTTCSIGQYRSGCGGSSAGTCIACTGLDTDFYWTGDGGLSNSCPSAACDTNCPTGEYRFGCGGSFATSTSSAGFCTAPNTKI